MSLDTFKSNLLSLLNSDSDIKISILNIINEPNIFHQSTKIQSNDKILSTNQNSLSSQILQLKKDLLSKSHQLNTLQLKYNSAIKYINSLKHKLSQQFPTGWKIFNDFQKISSSSKNLLSSVFVQLDNFSSFVCCCSQDSSFPKLWDHIKLCINHNIPDSSYLWNIFLHSIDLVNSSKTEIIYKIMNVSINSTFDLYYHSLSSNSKAQGLIREVILFGYINVYSNHVERKSIVRL